MNRLNRLFLLFFIIVSSLPGFVPGFHAHAIDPNETPGTATLVSSMTATNDQKEILIGLVFNLKQNWKIYAPSLKGKNDFEQLPPKITWFKETQNLKSFKITWPHPRKITTNNIDTYVYEGKTILPLLITVKDSSKPLFLKGKVEYLACNQICMPVEQTIFFFLPEGAGAETNWAAAIKAAYAGEDIVSHLEKISDEISFFMMIFFAFIGGIILNFMPCVLPILTLKLLTITKISKHTHDFSYRWRFFLTATGILTSFCFFALGTLALKVIGIQVGWGMHFQEPLFLIFMAFLMVIFACNLWGFFEIDLPHPLLKKINDALGQRPHVRVLSGDFLSGVFATLLATPCTAPFLGTSIGYSLSKGPVEIFMLFLALGIGFSIPYFIAIVLPKKWLKLPKPGPWMQKLTYLLGVGLAGTVVWILWVLGEELNFFSVLILGLLLTLLVINLKSKKKNIYVTTFIVVFGFIVPLFSDYLPSYETPQTSAQTLWSEFNENKIPDLLAHGKIVFVDVNAKWCITCQVNKAFVLTSKKILSVLNSPQVIAMSADWTLRDEYIANFLQKYKRFGIPFNIVFGPKAPEGIILSELLSEKEVLTAFERAGYKEP